MNSNATIQRDDTKVKSDIEALWADFSDNHINPTLTPLNSKRLGHYVSQSLISLLPSCLLYPRSDRHKILPIRLTHHHNAIFF